MPHIKLLSEKTINQIAAGEVIERPVSVVKELVENAIDAKATRIHILMENSGKNLISVSDNGCGISQEQLALAIERHATSKLNEDDINNIQFFGFRGEALPSIGAVAKMKITSRIKDSETAWQIQVDGGTKHAIIPASRDFGTTMEVRDLFCYTPTRLKFLKSDVAEKIAAVDLINRFALANPQVLFSLDFNGKTIIDAKPTPTLKQKVEEVLGEEFIKNAFEFNYEKNDIKIYGFAGSPTFNHSTSNNLYVFVNSRNIKDKLVATAIRVAYTNLIPQNRYPSIVLFIEINPYEVDVNVHPTKSEVRFRDANVVKNLISDTIRLALRKTLISTPPSLEPNNQIINDNFKPAPGFSQPFTNTFRSIYSNAAIASNLIAINRPIEENQFHTPQKETAPIEQTQLDLEKEHPLGLAQFQIYNTYIVAKSSQGIVIVDQHAAHERLVLEEIKNQLKKGKIKTQVLLIPSVIDLTVELTEKLSEFKDEIKSLGFAIDRNGNNQVAIREIPDVFCNCPLNILIKDLAELLFEFDSKEILTSKQEEILGEFACKNSVRAGRQLTIQEMNSLLRQIETTPFAGQCNHGRPTYYIVSHDELAKKFERV